MKIFFTINEENRVVNVSTSPIGEDSYEGCVDSFDIFETPTLYKYENGKLFREDEYLLTLMKQQKDIELNNKCNEMILKGFDYEIDGVVYHFSLDMEAQMNFQGVERLFAKNMIDRISWTVTQDGKYTRISIDKNLMDKLSLAILEHKNKNISKYRDELGKLLENAQTVEEVESITWE